ncbi:hypothetical protein EGW08_000552 [Elysia chlorotica]|uniref:Exonuclease domain-containing protein n=1 Tax=Elysia chlorotica TaxID=188477 RepID=A0A433UD37_ELYCH|nr:hypothetical protein EGW08_000552 [Elysia chlorotica]
MANAVTVPGKIQCFVLFDTETTGLPSVGNNPRITELCFLALTRDELEIKHAQVRVMNKLCLCFNPRKRISPTSTDLTGEREYYSVLQQLAPFKTQASMVCQFLQNLPQPVCLVAHNGNGYDFPLLVAHLKASHQQVPDVLCADSLEAFRSFDGLPPVPDFVLRDSRKETKSKVSYSLPKIFYRVFGQQPLVSHTAEDDCRTMLQVIRGSAITKFSQWCDQNAVSLRSISPMY